MQSTSIPALLSVAFAWNGAKNTIGKAPNSPHATLDDGFPVATMTELDKGGAAPDGKDFNGIFNWITQFQVWQNSGGMYPFDADQATAIGGYPKGAVIQSDDGQSAYVSLQENNVTNPNVPANVGSFWAPWAGAVTGAGNYALATGTANALTLALTPPRSAYTQGLVVVFKTHLANTAAVSLDAGAGSSALVRNDGVPLVAGDLLTGSVYSAVYDAASSKFVLLTPVTTQLDFGTSSTILTGGSENFAIASGTANAIQLALTPPRSGFTAGQEVVFIAVTANTGAVTVDAGGGVVPLVRSDGQALVAGDIKVGGLYCAVYNSVAPDFMLTSLVTSQIPVLPPVQVPTSLGFRNLIINPRRQINHTGYIWGTATTTSFQLCIDRWRIAVLGEKLNAPLDPNGGAPPPNWTLLPPGGMIQVVEGLSIRGGQYTISWAGTATCKVGGVDRTNGETFTLAADTNVSVHLIGSWDYVQLEPGNMATAFEERPVGLEISLCQRYTRRGVFHTGAAYMFESPGWWGIEASLPLGVEMRVIPTLTYEDMAGNKGKFTLWNGVTTHGCSLPAGDHGSIYTTIQSLEIDAAWQGSPASTILWMRLSFTLDAEIPYHGEIPIENPITLP